MKKYIRFMVAALVSPVYLPLWLISVVVTGAIEVLRDDDLVFWKKYHIAGLNWYLFK